MPNQNSNEKEQLRKLEKLIKKVIRNGLKDNTLDYSVQFTISTLEPGHVKYAAQISSPAQGVQPVTFIEDSFEALEAILKASEKEIDRRAVEIAFHKNRVNTLRSKADAHQARLEQMEKGEDLVEDDENIEMEEV